VSALSLPSSPTPASDRPTATPDWLRELIGVDAVSEGETVRVNRTALVLRGGILRDRSLISDSQQQTAEVFGFKWHQRDTFESQGMVSVVRNWLVGRYGDVSAAAWWSDYPPGAIVLDAGCGAAMSALELFGEVLKSKRYVGVDISNAVDVAAERFAERGLSAAFLQADITRLPLQPASAHVIFSEGVLHHTDSTRGALLSLAPILKPGGRFLFYVYRRKGPIREFTDDYIREQLQGMPPDEAWATLRPLSRFGQALGRLDIELEIPEAIDLLAIPAGRINLQRFVYWHLFKAYYRPDVTFDELHHVNYDWYAPANAHRQTPEDVRAWCAEAGLDIEHEDVCEAGITIIARKAAS
jgi:arsenite methyltransferase